jgi:hypothetical protein
MRTEHEDDPIIALVREANPVSDEEAAAAERPGEREAIRRRASELARARRPGFRGLITERRRLVLGLAGAGALAAIGALALLTGGNVATSPDPALAIERTPKWVILRIENPDASDEEMNAELAAAGIDRIRVISLPGSPRDVGTWAGHAEFGPICAGGVDRFGDYGVDIPVAREYTTGPEDNRDLIDLTVPPTTGALAVGEVGTPYSGDTARIDTDAVDDPRYTAMILVPIRAEREDDTIWSNVIGTEQLIALGGVFEGYGRALEDGETTCEEFGLKPHPDILPAADGEIPGDRIPFPAAGCAREIAPEQAGVYLKDIPEPPRLELRECTHEVLLGETAASG